LPKVLHDIEGDIYFLAWTTTPWTLPSNTALTVGKKIDYVVVKSYNQYTFEPTNIIAAKNLISTLFKKKFVKVDSEKELRSYKEGDKKSHILYPKQL